MLNGKVVIVTGGAGLIGREFVRAVVGQGGTVIIADINQAMGVQARDDLRELCNSSKIDFLKLDINSKDSINGLIDLVVERHEQIDAVVNNAYPRNKNYGRHFFDVEYEDFCENLNLNLGGYFLVCQQFAAYFKKQGYGNIVNVASIYGVVAPKFEIYGDTGMTMPVEYAAIKSGIIHMTKYIAKYLKGVNVRVNAISPGGIFDSQPADFLSAYRNLCINKGMLDKADICGTLIYLLSDLSLCVNGQNLIVDDGFCL